ncbi:MAG: hypothetical protein IT210_08955 [Armatimonadetes bacterium]|nr:hypothetical protein [Armatimonadota bacterium]
MTVTLNLSAEVETKLSALAQQHGTPVETYLERLLEQTFREPTEADRGAWIEATFAAVDRKYGEALQNLARQ